MHSSAHLQSTEPLRVDQVYRDHFDFVWTNLRRFGVPRELLEDACHDVFVVVHRRAHHFDATRSSVRTWVFGIVRRIASDHRRRRQRHNRRMNSVRAHVAAANRGPRRDAAEARALLMEFLASIDDQNAEIFVLSQLYGTSAREIAASLGLNANTVASRIRVTRKRFKALAQQADIPHVDDERAPQGAKARVLAALAPSVQPVPKPTILGGLKLAGLVGCLVCAAGVSFAPPKSPDPELRIADTAARTFVTHSGPTIPLARPDLDARSQTMPPPVRKKRRARVSRKRAAASDDQHPATAPPPRPPNTHFREELALLHQARAAAKTGNTDAALRSVQDHARRFPNGVLRPEMDLIRVSSLCHAGRNTQANAEARRLGITGGHGEICHEAESRPSASQAPKTLD